MRTAFIAPALLAVLAWPPAVLPQSTPAAPDAVHGGPHAMHAPMAQGAMRSSPGAAKAPFDLQFLDTMSAHHESAIEMAQLVEQRSARDALKRMAQKIIADQQREITQMQEWKRQWYEGKAEAINMKMPGMAASMRNMRMDRLEAASGDAFDALFLSMMRRHHEGAIVMARTAAAKAGHKELKEFAGRMAEAQKQEAVQMVQWQKEWAPDAK